MSDYIVRATAADLKIRAFAIDSTELVEYARQRHNTSPVATAALGRLLSAGAMMGVMMKGEKDVLTIQMKGDGPIEGLTVTADSHGNVKGYPGNPDVYIPLNYAGKLDVGAAIGYGELVVIKDLGLKEPYVSQTPLGTSEVAEDLTFYFAKSEQTPSSVALGVLVDKEGKVMHAGGFIIQVMPFIDEETVEKLEKRIGAITSVTSMMAKGMSPEDILNEILGDMDLQITDRIETQFKCDCSKSKVSRALIAMGRKELKEIISEGKEIEVKCHFCNTAYTYSVKEMQFLLETAVLKSAAGKLGIKEHSGQDETHDQEN